MNTNYGIDKNGLASLAIPHTLWKEEDLIKVFKVLPTKEDLEKQSSVEYCGKEKTDDMNHENGILYDQHNRVTYIIQGILHLNQKEFIRQKYIPYKKRYGITFVLRDDIEEEIRKMDEINQQIVNYEGEIYGIIELIEKFYKIIYGNSFNVQKDIQKKIQEAKEYSMEEKNRNFRYIK